MLSAWSQHLRHDPEAKEKFEDYVKNSTLLTNRLMDMIDEVIAGVEKAERSPEVFSNPNWQYLQAYYNGGVGFLEKLKKILSTDQKKDHGQLTRPNESTDR